MSEWIANARMYAVTPAVESAWRELLEHIAPNAGVALDYLPYPAPQPLERLWARRDLGRGVHVRLSGGAAAGARDPARRADPAAPRGRGGEALYRSDLIVRTETPYRRLADTFGGRAG